MKAAALEKLCTDLKGTTQDLKWGNDLCYLVGNKMYCVVLLDESHAVSFKTIPEDFAELTEREGIIPAPYSARYHWVLVSNPLALTAKEWKHFVEKSYELVFDKLPRKVKIAI